MSSRYHHQGGGYHQQSSAGYGQEAPPRYGVPDGHATYSSWGAAQPHHRPPRPGYHQHSQNAPRHGQPNQAGRSRSSDEQVQLSQDARLFQNEMRTAATELRAMYAHSAAQFKGAVLDAQLSALPKFD